MIIVRLLIVFICILISGTGCKLIPKTVEFFQDKVKPVPTQTEKAKETERQAVQYVNVKVNEALLESVKNGVTNTIVDPLIDAKIVIEPLSGSLGPPSGAWKGSGSTLAEELNKNTALLNKKLDRYREDIKENEGKKIEGTGLLQIPYLIWLLIVGVGLLALYIVIRSVIQALTIASGVGVPMSVGLKSVSGIAGKTVKTGFIQVIKGIEKTKDHFKKSNQTTFTRDEILEIIKNEQIKSQNTDVQNLIRELTHN